MRNAYVQCLVAILMSAGMSNCGGGGDGELPPLRIALKIALTDSLSVERDDDKRLLPENLRELCAVLQSDNKNCYRTYILDPTLVRVDMNNEQFSLKTEIKKGGAKNVESPKVIGKLIQKNFDDLEIPKSFTKGQSSKTKADSLLRNFVSTQATKDSVLVFDETGSLDSCSLNGRKYIVYSDVEEVRKRMLAILCENSKANFTLLMNPPASVSEPSSSTLTGPKTTTITSTTVVKLGGGDRKPIIKTGTRKIRSGGSINGDLTMIKDSEGCDICTRYYAATDNLGRQHEIKEVNSTVCCPCGKTVEIRGRTYRMECSGSGSNRLAQVTE